MRKRTSRWSGSGRSARAPRGGSHAAALGELAAQLALDEAPFADIGFLDPRRFVAAPQLARG